ncbi:hypothetical protein BAUCODRAFT_57280, partial [Baudoinia panamericana UAMH 10762]
ARSSVTVPCYSNGHITLDIYTPTRPASPTDARSTAAILYLPRVPALLGNERDDANIKAFLEQQSHPVVSIKYRLSREHPYPMPIHDVVTGFDWVKENLLPKRAISRAGRADHIGKVAVCGELVGGGLAAMLALTECRVGQPGVVAAALKDPLVDWVDVLDGPREIVGGIVSDGNGLHSLRSQAFRKPEHYFDPFASPMLFLRSAGLEIPLAPAEIPSDDLELLSYLERQEFERSQQDLHTGTLQDAQSLKSRRTMKTAKRYPSASLGLKLPDVRVWTSNHSLLRGQAEEFVRRLRQSHLRQASAGD